MNDTFYNTKAASIHLHVLGPNEVCQLHVQTFTFNDFVKPDDPALLRASPPSIVDLPGRLSEFLKTDQAAELAPLPALGGTLFTLFVRDAYVVAAQGKEPVSFYVVQGEGEIDAGKHSALKHGDLAMMTHGAGARLTAHSGKPLVGLLFYPER